MMMFEPLLADLDWGRIAIIIIFVVGPLIGQLFKADPKGPPQRRSLPPGGPQPPQKPLDQEIADFLRQAQQNANRPRGQQQAPAPDATRPPARPPVRQPDPKLPVKAEPRGKGPMARPQPPRQPGQPAAAGQKPPKRARRRTLSDNVGQHVSEHLDTSSISKQTESLGGRVRTADENVEQRLRNVFDHQLGELDAQLEKTAIREGTDDASWQDLTEKRKREAETRALQIGDIVRMLRDPMAVRDAIILGEVLQPPISERPSF